VHHRRVNRSQYIHILDEEFSCMDQYATSMRQMLELIESFPAILKVWQTTQAGRHKWCVYGVAWPLKSLQIMQWGI
jgi:hypothetical protein